MDSKIIRLDSSPVGFGDTPDELEPEMFESGLPVQHTHSYFEDDELGLYVGVWDTTSMTETPAPYACDEFMWLLQGEVGIRNNQTGLVEQVQAGEAFVIPRGYDCQWQQSGYLRKFFVIYEPPEQPLPQAPAVEGIVKPALVSNADLSAGAIATSSYRDVGGHFSAGSWQSEAFEFGVSNKPYHQFVYVVEGTLQVEDNSGELQSFEAGDAFFIPQGITSRWSSKARLGILSVKVSA